MSNEVLLIGGPLHGQITYSGMGEYIHMPVMDTGLNQYGMNWHHERYKRLTKDVYVYNPPENSSNS